MTAALRSAPGSLDKVSAAALGQIPAISLALVVRLAAFEMTCAPAGPPGLAPAATADDRMLMRACRMKQKAKPAGPLGRAPSAAWRGAGSGRGARVDAGRHLRTVTTLNQESEQSGPPQIPTNIEAVNRVTGRYRVNH